MRCIKRAHRQHLKLHFTGTAIYRVLNDKIPSSSSSPSVTADSSNEVEQANRSTQKRNNAQGEEDTDSCSVPAKRLKSGSTESSTSTSSATRSACTTTSAWDTAMSRAGLDPFAAEIRLLSDRIAKVATFHLRVFRNLYEGIESARHRVDASSSLA